MSNHFTYEINERNLKMKLKDLELPLDEEAVQQFEERIHAQSGQAMQRNFKQFAIPLGSNLTLPLVFGGLVLLFSLLLYNFISIKNPAGKTAAEPLPSPVIPAAQVQPALSTPHLPYTPAAQNVPSEAIKEKETGIKTEKVVQPEPPAPPKIANTMPVQTTSLSGTPANTPANTTTSLSADKPASPTPSSQPVVKKKQRRESPDVMETNNAEARPAVTEIDRETPSRPN